MNADAAKKRIALYGGSFNPPHICHQLAVMYVLESGLCDEVWLIPVFHHAFDKQSAPYEVRRSLCEALLEPFGGRASICDIEKELGGVSRTIDTLEALQARHPQYEFILLMGSDLRAELPRWKESERLQKLARIIWICRSGESPHPDDTILLPDVSSTQIRELLRSGKNASAFVPARVLRKWEELGKPEM